MARSRKDIYEELVKRGYKDKADATLKNAWFDLKTLKKNQTNINNKTKTNSTTTANSPYNNNYSTPKQQTNKGNLVGGINFWDVRWAKNFNKWNSMGVSTTNNNYNKNINQDLLQKWYNSWAIFFWDRAKNYESKNTWYLSKRNDTIASGLWNEWKKTKQDISSYLSQYNDFNSYNDEDKQNTIQAIYNRMGNVANQNNQNNQNNNNNQNLNNQDLNNQNQQWQDNNQNNQNTNQNTQWWDYREFVDNTIWNAYDNFNNLEDIRNVYWEEWYQSLKRQLDAAKKSYDMTNPEERNRLAGDMQAMIGAYIGQKSEQSAIKGGMDAVLSLFGDEDQQRIRQDVSELERLQWMGKTNQAIAKEMWIPLDQLNQLWLLKQGNWATQLWKYYNLSEKEKARISEKYDTRRQRLKEDFEIANQRHDQDLRRLAEDHNKTYSRQQKQNKTNLWNVNKLARMSGIWFSSAGIEGMQAIQTQAKNILDDLTTNYERGKTRINQVKIDLARAYKRNDKDTIKALNESLTQAKNNYLSWIAQAQAKYGLVGIEWQKALAETTKWFIKQAENIYNVAQENVRKNFQALQNWMMNMRAMEYKDYTFKQKKLQEFEKNSLYMTQDQALQYAQEHDLVANVDQLARYQTAGAVNYLEKQWKWLGIRFQWAIETLLGKGQTPAQAIRQVMQSREYQQLTATTTKDPNNKYLKVGENTYYNPSTGQTVDGEGITTQLSNQRQKQATEQATVQGLQNFLSNKKVGDDGKQCGGFVNDYLESLGWARIFQDPISQKKKLANSTTPSVWAIAIIDSPTQPKYWHVGIITWINDDWTVNVVDSNNKGQEKIGKQVWKTENILGYYDPRKNWTTETKSDTFDKNLVKDYEKYLNGKLTSADWKTIEKDKYVFKKEAQSWLRNENKKISPLAQEQIEVLKELKNLGRKSRLAMQDWNIGRMTTTFSSELADKKALYQNFLSKTTLQNLVTLKANGATFGALSDNELSFLKDSATYLKLNLSDKKRNETIDKTIKVLQKTKNIAEGGNPSTKTEEEISLIKNNKRG